MGKFIVFTFLMLGWAFFEMSGGRDFVPEVREIAEAEVIAPTPAVTRSVATPTLISFNRVETSTLSGAPVQSEVIAPITEAALSVVEDVTPAPENVVAEIAPPPLDLRLVDARRVNMRAGPGTNFDVVDAFDRGTEAEVLLVDADGWAQIRITTTGQTGWMAARLLTDS